MWQEPLRAGAWEWERRASAPTPATWESLSGTSTWLHLTVRPALPSCRVAPGQARGHGGRGSLRLRKLGLALAWAALRMQEAVEWLKGSLVTGEVCMFGQEGGWGSRQPWGSVRRGGLDQVWGCRRGEPVLSVRGAVRSAEPWWKGRGAVEGESGAQRARLSAVTPLGAGVRGVEREQTPGGRGQRPALPPGWGPVLPSVWSPLPGSFSPTCFLC